MRKFIFSAAVIALTVGIATSTVAQSDKSDQVLFTNCNVFDGKADSLASGRNVLVEGNLIKTISSKALDVPDATAIDCDGRTLMPGLIDAHTHLYMNMAGGHGEGNLG